jgi:menaquinol-cytochrome c reductase iron-sulfur subunit
MRVPQMHDRRAFLGRLTIALGSLMGLALAIPGIRFLFDPLFKKGQGSTFRKLTKLSQLEPGKPQSFPIVESRRDAWIRYPEEQVGTVWLIRQPEGSNPRVVAFTGQCPHKGCAVGFQTEGKFLCPCHNAEFDIQGKPLKEIAPRGMDTLELELSSDADPEIRVKFELFRPMLKEKKPLV